MRNAENADAKFDRFIENSIFYGAMAAGLMLYLPGMVGLLNSFGIINISNSFPSVGPIYIAFALVGGIVFAIAVFAKHGYTLSPRVRQKCEPTSTDERDQILGMRFDQEWNDHITMGCVK